MAGLRIKLLTRLGIWSPACRLQSTAHACVVRSAKLVTSAYATAVVAVTNGQLDTWAAAISAKVCPADCAPDRSSVPMPSVSARW